MAVVGTIITLFNLYNYIFISVAQRFLDMGIIFHFMSEHYGYYDLTEIKNRPSWIIHTIRFCNKHFLLKWTTWYTYMNRTKTALCSTSVSRAVFTNNLCSIYMNSTRYKRDQGGVTPTVYKPLCVQFSTTSVSLNSLNLLGQLAEPVSLDVSFKSVQIATFYEANFADNLVHFGGGSVNWIPTSGPQLWQHFTKT